MEIKQRIEHLIQCMSEGIFEKQHIISMALLCAIAGESIFLLGPPGTAKSLVARRLKMIFSHGRSFEYLMSRFSTPDEIFGPVSISKLKNEDIYERKVDGYLPSATIVFLDEIWKAGPAIQNALLTAVNEHIFQNGQCTIELPMKVLIAASNELPAEDEGLEALWDRFLVRVVSNCIEKESTFFKMVKQRSQPKVEIPDKLKITDLDYVTWQECMEDVEITDEVCAVVSAIRKGLKEEAKKEGALPFDYYISDRRWKKLFHLMRASAFLNGRQKTDYSDCLLLYHCLWNKDLCIPSILSIVARSFTAGVCKKIEQLQKEADKYVAAFADAEKSGTDGRAVDFMVADYFYYVVENYPDGRCLCSIGDYSHSIGPKKTQGYVYYNTQKRAYFVRSLGKDATMAINVKNQESLRKVSLQSTATGLVIDNVPYNFVRQGKSNGSEPAKMLPSLPSKVSLENIMKTIEQELKPKMESLNQCLNGEANLFVSEEDIKITRKSVAETERQLQELCMKVINVQRL